MNNVKFHKYYVTNGVTKARVRYSPNIGVDSKRYITLYEKDYEDNLPKVCAGVKNDTDAMTDYFEENRVRYVEGSTEYRELLPKLRAWGFAR